MKRFLLCVLCACGVEETGFLTDEGVFFTEDGAARVVVVRPEAVQRLGGELVVETLEGEVLGRGLLEDSGLAWSIGSEEQVRLVYALEGVDMREVEVRVAEGAAPTEDPQSLLADWVAAEGTALVVYPEVLLGTLPYLVVNVTQGASVVASSADPVALAGTSGDRVCVSSVSDAGSTPSLCKDVP